VPQDNHAGIALYQALGFEHVDVGRVFQKVNPQDGVTA
jgi:hypothetical protein